jgi:hypothetical protein
MGSTVQTGDIATGAGYGTEVRVFNSGKVGGTGDDTLVYRGAEEEFLTGGAGSNDTVTVAAGGSSNDWYVTVFGKDSTQLPDYVRADAGKAVFAFTNVANTSNMAYAQAENIDVGNTGFTVTDAGVLSIDGTQGQTVRVNEMAFGAESSLQVGSGLGSDTFIDSADDNARVDTVVYSQQVLGAALNTRDELLGQIANLIMPTATSNVLEVKIGNTVDSLQGVERLRFDVDGGAVDVALIGNSDGADGYDSLTSAMNDKSATDVVYLVDRSLMATDRSSVALLVESVVSTDLEGHLQVTWAGASASFVGTSQVVFATAQGPLTVWVVGGEGYNLRNVDGTINAQASLDAAVGQAHAGDVIFISPDLLTGPLTYTVNTDGLVFLVNSTSATDATNQLTLNMGYSEGDTPETSVLVHDLFLLGNANVTVNGNELANVIGGNRGDNKLYGFGGADLMDAGGGSDQVYGGAGNDVLVAQSGAGATSGKASLLNGGSGDDLLIAATTDGSRIDMTGGAGADTFKVAALSADNGALKLNVIVKDLNYQGGDDLDFTQIMKGSRAATASDLAYSTPNSTPTYTFGNTAGFKSTATDIGTEGQETGSTVGVTGTVKVEKSGTTNVTNALLVKGETGQDVADGRAVGSTAAADIYHQGSVAAALDPAASSHQGSIASELSYLVPLFEHNPLG